MRARACLLALAFTCLSAATACTVNLTRNARNQGRASMGCDDAQFKMRATGAEDRRIVVYGCGSYEVYEGNCNAELNGCERMSMSDDCDGSCRVRRTGHGELTENGEIPEGVIKGEELEEE
jgi:hypothetical protein